ncbi:MAG: hypothetical protein QMB11_04935 [Nonlabens sp.]|jgi:hypothetical protein
MSYASLSDRDKAWYMDEIVLIMTLFLTSEILAHFENVPAS